MVSTDLSRLVDRVALALRTRGERMTEPRRAVLAALVSHPGHATAEELVEEVSRIAPRVHRASVYRSLEALVDLGVVQHVHLGKGGTAYHLVASDGAHLHAQCTQCGAVVDLPGLLMDDVRAQLREHYGFRLDAGHVALAGVCGDCSGQGPAREPGLPGRTLSHGD